MAVTEILEQEKRMPARSSRSCRVETGFWALLGVLLIVAAVLKGYHAAHDGAPSAQVFNSTKLYVLLVVAEYLLGLWLLTGLYRKVTRLATMLVFLGLTEAALWLAITGQSSCGCLGRVQLSPWFAVGIDVAIFVGLALLRLDGPERTLRTHPLMFYGLLLVALGSAVPGVLTMTVYARESPTFSYNLRHDPLLHNTKVVVALADPTARDLLQVVEAQTGKRLTVDSAIHQAFLTCKPDWKSLNHHSVRGWTALEAVSRRMPVRSRWIRESDGYTLIADNPLQRAKLYWLAGLALGLVGCGMAALCRNRQDAARDTAPRMPQAPPDQPTAESPQLHGNALPRRPQAAPEPPESRPRIGARTPLRFGIAFFVIPTLALPSAQADPVEPPADWEEVRTETFWCGAKALWLLAHSARAECTFEEVKRLCDPTSSSQGMLTLGQLRTAAERLGFAAQPVRCRRDWLDAGGFLAITLHKPMAPDVADRPYYHYMVYLPPTESGKVRLIDPLYSTEIVQTPAEAFESTWTGEALLISAHRNNLPTSSPPYGLCLGLIALGAPLVTLAYYSHRRRMKKCLCHLLMGLCVLQGSGCSNAEISPSDGGPVDLKFDSLRFDAGTIRASSGSLKVRHSFPFVNTGSSPVTIVSAHRECSCAAVSYPPDPIPPGEAGVVEVTVSFEGRLGTFSTATVLQTKPDSGEVHNNIKLAISGFVVGESQAFPTVLDFGPTPAGSPAKRSVDVQIPLAPEEPVPQAVQARGSREGLTYSVGPIRVLEAPSPGGPPPMRSAAFTLTATLLSSTPGAQIDDTVSVSREGSSEPLAIRCVAAITHPDFTLSPLSVNFGPIAKGRCLRRLVLRSTSPGRFPTVKQIDTSADSRLRAWLEDRPDRPEEKVLWVELSGAGRGVVEGSIELIMDGSRFMTYRIPYTGYYID
jgi:Protein of unknown function (DUF1573)/Peptidase C39 family